MRKGSLNEIAAEIHTANRKWWVDLETGQPRERNVGEMLMLVTSELAEAMEGHRKSSMDDHLPQYKMFDVELIDAFIRLFDLAAGRGVDLDTIYEAKMAYNAIRKDHTDEARRLSGGKKY